MIRRPPRSTPFPTRRSSDLATAKGARLHQVENYRRDDEDMDRGRDHAADDRRRKDRKSTRLNSSHTVISYAVFCLKKKKNIAGITSASMHQAHDGQRSNTKL